MGGGTDTASGLRQAARRIAIDLTPLSSSRDFRRAWISSLSSSFGLEFVLVALPIQLYEQTHSTLAGGLS